MKKTLYFSALTKVTAIFPNRTWNQDKHTLSPNNHQRDSTICLNSITNKENPSIPTHHHQNGCATCPNSTANKEKPSKPHIITKVTESSAPVINHMFNSQ